MRPTTRRLLFWSLLGIVVLLLGGWGMWNHPRTKERRYSALSLEALQQVHRADPTDTIAAYYLGLRLNQAARFVEASQVLAQAATLDPDVARLRDEWAQAQVGSGQSNEAFNQLKQFVGTHPQSAEAHLLLGKFYVSMNAFQRAREELQVAVQRDPQLGEGWFYLSRALESGVNPIPAREAVEKAVRLLPHHADAHLQLGLLLTQEGRLAEARPLLEKALSLAPQRADIARLYADWLLNHHATAADTARAVTLVRQVAYRDPTDGLAHQTLGLALLQQGLATEAVAPLQQAVTLLPNDPIAARELARIYRQVGNREQAVRWERTYLARQKFKSEADRLRTAVLTHPQDTALARRLAHLLGTHGDAPGCVRYYAKALGQPHDSAPVLALAVQDLLTGGYAEIAVPLAHRAAELAPSDAKVQSLLKQALHPSPPPRTP